MNKDIKEKVEQHRANDAVNMPKRDSPPAQERITHHEATKGPNRIVASLKHEWENFRMGDGHVWAMVRMGWKELAQVLQPFAPDIHPIEEPGAAGVLSQKEVASERSAGNRIEIATPRVGNPVNDRDRGIER